MTRWQRFCRWMAGDPQGGKREWNVAIRWPLMISVPGPRQPQLLVPGDWHWKMVRREWDFDRVWLAPWWIAWLYRLLPCRVGMCIGDWGDGWFLWNVECPIGRIGWLPASRSNYGGQMVDGRWMLPRWGGRPVLVVDWDDHHVPLFEL